MESIDLQIYELEQTREVLEKEKKARAKVKRLEAQHEWKQVDVRDLYDWTPEVVKERRCDSFPEIGGIRFRGVLSERGRERVESFQARFPDYLKERDSHGFYDKVPGDKAHSCIYWGDMDSIPGKVILSWHGDGRHIFNHPVFRKDMRNSFDNRKPYCVLNLEEWDVFQKTGGF